MSYLDHAAVGKTELSRLVYELLDAHSDTLQLAEDLDQAQPWRAHLDYLRGLQRVGREVLARLES